ncbi:hypothetical protein FG87_30635 [Nocardia vulneris]|uniref:Uncharacterized protein n=1 Tax=Nocardia vulneris TaxID=1141657 RepID=A0ABR4Z8P0_9NOCA|nr:hypothetical protein FG87_30635 [Nocardia vulneris]
MFRPCGNQNDEIEGIRLAWPTLGEASQDQCMLREDIAGTIHSRLFRAVYNCPDRAGGFEC